MASNAYATMGEEHEEGVLVDNPDIGTLAVLNKSEIDQQIATAKHYPRSIKQFRNEALQLATLDEQTASECIYALPRDGKTIEGPSARFAEILGYSWGNARIGARSLGDDGEFTKSQGMFYDLEKNVAITYEISRRIVDKRGRRYSADMIGTTSNAASSIALRNAVLKGIPKAIWRPIYDSARSVVAGDIRTLANRRGEALKAFAIYGVQPDRIYMVLGVKGKEDIGIEHLVLLRGMLTALKEGDSTAEEMFKAPAERNGDNVADATRHATEALKDRYVKPAGNANPQQPSPDGNQQPVTAEGETGTQGNTSTLPTGEAAMAQEKLHGRRSGRGGFHQPTASEVFPGGDK